MSRPRRLVAALVVLPTALAATLLTRPDQASGQAVSSIDARWEDDAGVTAPGQDLRAVVDVAAQPDGAGSEVRLTLDGAEVRGIPAGCASSSTTERLSWVSADHRTLVCRLDAAAADVQVAVTAVVTAPAGGTVSGTAVAGSASAALPVRTVGTVPAGSEAAPDPRLLRLVSSPDFLNADVGDLRRGPGSWTHRASSNTTNTSYQTSLAHVLDDWQSLDPDAVLVAGDLVNGHWDRDSARTRTFGPTRTVAQKRAAIRRAARTYYPQWLERFTSRGLDVHPAIGDHEVGDNPFDATKRRLVPAFKQQFAREFTASGRRGTDHPRGPASGTAYAFRPVPQVQVVSLDLFDVTARRARVDVDRRQMQWLRRVLARAQADGVTWTIVQGHVPILEPVRTRGSSGLHVRGAERSALWRTFARYGVDLYLAGEVHDVTMSEAAGVTQLTHGGLFQFGLTTYALIDAHPDHLDIDLRDYATVVRRHGRRLWQTRLPGIPRTVEVAAEPFTIGTARLAASGAITERTGILLPWQRGR